MNIFVLDLDPVKAAQLQCDKHVVKMILETAQLLCTAHRMIDGKLVETKTASGRKGRHYQLDDEREDILYKACHYNHPSAVWVRESVDNYNWLYRHFIALSAEYKHRYNKEHATFTKLGSILSVWPHNLTTQEQTPFKLAMNNEPQCINEADPVGSYRKYYLTKRERFSMIWTKREIPTWFAEAA